MILTPTRKAPPPPPDRTASGTGPGGGSLAWLAGSPSSHGSSSATTRRFRKPAPPPATAPQSWRPQRRMQPSARAEQCSAQEPARRQRRAPPAQAAEPAARRALRGVPGAPPDGKEGEAARRRAWTPNSHLLAPFGLVSGAHQKNSVPSEYKPMRAQQHGRDTRPSGTSNPLEMTRGQPEIAATPRAMRKPGTAKPDAAAANVISWAGALPPQDAASLLARRARRPLQGAVSDSAGVIDYRHSNGVAPLTRAFQDTRRADRASYEAALAGFHAQRREAAGAVPDYAINRARGEANYNVFSYDAAPTPRPHTARV